MTIAYRACPRCITGDVSYPRTNGRNGNIYTTIEPFCIQCGYVEFSRTDGISQPQPTMSDTKTQVQPRLKFHKVTLAIKIEKSPLKTSWARKPTAPMKPTTTRQIHIIYQVGVGGKFRPVAFPSHIEGIGWEIPWADKRSSMMRHVRCALQCQFIALTGYKLTQIRTYQKEAITWGNG